MARHNEQDTHLGLPYRLLPEPFRHVHLRSAMERRQIEVWQNWRHEEVEERAFIDSQERLSTGRAGSPETSFRRLIAIHEVLSGVEQKDRKKRVQEAPFFVTNT